MKLVEKDVNEFKKLNPKTPKVNKTKPKLEIEVPCLTETNAEKNKNVEVIKNVKI
jgi:hypothetical protein